MSSTPTDWRSDPRSFRDDEGRAWLVFELRRPGADCESVTVLVFESDMVIRCVRRFPADWRALPAETLEALSWEV